MASASGIMPMFLCGVEPDTLEGSIPLAVCGSAGSGLFGGLDLYLLSNTYPSGVLPLYLAGPDSDTLTAPMNLWVQGGTTTLENSLPLVLCQSGVQGSLNLFVKGDGTTPGAYPGSGYMDLFLARQPAESLNFFLQGPGTVMESGIPLVVIGASGLLGSLYLVMPDTVGTAQRGVTLYTHGY